MLTKVVAMNKIKYLILFLGTFVFIAGAYIVKKGDTLWDLSESFFNDPFFWPDLWESLLTSISGVLEEKMLGEDFLTRNIY